MGKHIRFDWAMKRMLRQKANFDILEGFLSELLMQKIKIAEILESETNQDEEENKFNRFDILVRNSEGELMLIEVQNERERDYFHRMNFGQAKLLSETLGEAQAYEKIKKIYSINIVYFNLGQGSDYVYKGKTEFVGIHKNDILQLNRSQKDAYHIKEVADVFTTYYVLKVNSFNDHAVNNLDQWIYFLKNNEIKDEFKAQGLAEAKEKLRVDNLNKEEKASYNHFIKTRRIQENEIITAKQDGYSEAEKELIPKIEEERRQKEEAKAREEEAKTREEEAKTREEEAKAKIKNTIIKLNSKGMNIEEISDLTGEPEEAIRKILNT